MIPLGAKIGNQRRLGDQDEDEEAEARQSSGEEDEVEAELAKQHLADFFSQNLQDSPLIQWRLTYIGSDISNLNYLARQYSTSQHIYHFACSNSYAPRVLKGLDGGSTPNIISRDAFVLPPKRVSDVLIAAYFEHVHGWFPLIDREGFLRAYEHPNQTPPLLLFQAVCLAGSHVQSSLANTRDLKIAFFRRTKALFDARYEEDRMHMVQAALLMSWFSDGGDDVCANAWWWIGVASRVALGLGMHRNVGPSNMADADKRTWRRIWWCLVQFDLLVSLCYGRPQNM
jgi:transcriptional regulatory protein AMDR